MRIVFLIVASLSFASCNNTPGKQADSNYASDTANYTTIQWMDTIKDVGILTFGEKKEIQFSFTNTGSHPLMIIDAQPTCGCTVADYPREPIAPGKEGVITAGFDTKKGSEGVFNKSILIVTNTKGATNTNLVFKGEIKKT